MKSRSIILQRNLYVVSEQLFTASATNDDIADPYSTLSPTLGSKTAKCKKLTSFKLIVRTMS